VSQLFDVEAWEKILLRALSELGATLAAFLPSLVGALVILGVGWGISRIVQLAAGRALHTLGFDRVAVRIHLTETLRRAGLARPPSELVALLLFWVLMLTFLLSSVETLGLTAVTATIDRLIAFLPGVIGAGVIALLGLLLARFVGTLVSSGAAAAGIPRAPRLGAVAHGLVVTLVLIVAAQQLGVDTQILVGPVTAAVAAAGLTAGFAFALGARPVVTHILAGHFLRQSLPRDVPVEVEGRRGMVERVGPTDTLLRDGEEAWSIPNGRLLEQTVGRGTAPRAGAS